MFKFKTVGVSKTKNFIERIKEGEQKSFRQWGAELYPDDEHERQYDRARSMCTMLRSAKRKNKVYIYPIYSGGPLVLAENEDEIDFVIKNGQKNVKGSIRNMVGFAERLGTVGHSQANQAIGAIKELFGFGDKLIDDKKYGKK